MTGVVSLTRREGLDLVPSGRKIPTCFFQVICTAV